MENSNIIPHQHNISTADRSAIKHHQPAVLWFTGLSGSGKSTIANAVEQELCHQYKVHTYLLDGDNIRTGLNKGLTFSDDDRKENIRRIGEVCKLFVDAGIIVLSAFISPFIADREQVRNLVPEGRFIEIFVDCPLRICEQRDPKGLYKKARKGEIKHFTGIDSAYEKPLSPEIVVNSSELSIEDCSAKIIATLLELHFIESPEKE
jgi:adenylylsulfate kinase